MSYSRLSRYECWMKGKSLNLYWILPDEWFLVEKKRRHDTQNNDTQRNNIEHNDIEHNENHHYDTQHNDTQYNNTQHNDIWIYCRIFEHFATKPDLVTEFIKVRSAIIFKHFAANPDPVTEFIKLGSALPSKVPLWRQN